MKNIINKIIEFLVEGFGGIKLENIIIPKNFKMPNEEKLAAKKTFYIMNGYFYDNIILDEHNKLIDGYTTYLIAKKYGFKYIGVTRVKLKN